LHPKKQNKAIFVFYKTRKNKLQFIGVVCLTFLSRKKSKQKKAAAKKIFYGLLLKEAIEQLL